MALRMAAGVRMSRAPRPSWCRRKIARAERRAASSQTGWPEGASAVCGSERPSASPTTCEVAAVPRNWQPPPGDAQARQPTSAAYSSVIWFWAKRAPMVCTLPASSPDSGSSVTPPGTSTAGFFPDRCQRHHHCGQALVAGGHADHTLAGGQRAHQAAQNDRGIVAIGQASPSSRLCLACGRRRDRCTLPRTEWRAEISARAQPRPPAGRLPSGRCESRARWPRHSPRAGRHACSGSETRDRGGDSAPSPFLRFASGRRDCRRAQ